MKYNPPEEKNDENNDYYNSGFRPDQIPSSEETKFIRFGTMLERDDTTTKDFIDRHPNLSRSVNKWMALANYKNQVQKQLERLRRMEIPMCEECGLHDLAEEITLDTIGDAQFSRGWDGFYTKELSTQRQKVKDETERNEHRKLSFFKNKKEPDADESNVSWR